MSDFNIDRSKLPRWHDPFKWQWPEVSNHDNNYRIELTADAETLTRNMVEMVRAAEDEWYIRLITEVLQTKGYEVVKRDNSD